jgi:hypothetical protein
MAIHKEVNKKVKYGVYFQSNKHLKKVMQVQWIISL